MGERASGGSSARDHGITGQMNAGGRANCQGCETAGRRRMVQEVAVAVDLRTQSQQQHAGLTRPWQPLPACLPPGQR